jgi:hypothetical protein
LNEQYFLAVCKDLPHDPNGFYYTVYFVNNSNQEIESLRSESVGFVTYDDELIQTSTCKKELGKVPAHSFVEIETDDEGAFDFVIQFDFHLTFSNEETKKKSITIGKYLRGGIRPINPLPVLEKRGYTFKLVGE